MSTSINSPIARGRQILKVDIIRDAYSQMRISGLTTDPTPEDLELALIRLEDMAAEWDSAMMKVGYAFEDEPDPNTPTNIPSWSKLAFSQQLACMLLSDFGKTITAELKMKCDASMSNLASRTAAERIRGVDYPQRMARGSGNTLRWNRWSRFYREGQLPNAARVERIYVGDIQDYTVHFDNYLKDFEYIDSVDLQISSNLLLLESDNTDNDVTYRIQGTSSVDDRYDYSAIVTVIVTTTEGRVVTRNFYYELVARNPY